MRCLPRNRMNTPKTDIPETKPEPKQKKRNLKVLISVSAAIGLLLIISISFSGGVFVGFHKAKFSCDWGKNYERNFMGPRPGMKNDRPGPGGFMGPMMREFEGRDFRNPHGIAGTIISISDGSLIVKDKDNRENTVAVTDKTIIKSGSADLKLNDLKVDDKIVVIGRPGDGGVINASLIRVFNGS